MRLDKFLKVSRLVKRRETAKELCDFGAVKTNGKVSKPSSEVNGGDVLELKLGRHHLKVKVLEIRPYANKQTASSLYEVLEDRLEERKENHDVGF